MDAATQVPEAATESTPDIPVVDSGRRPRSVVVHLLIVLASVVMLVTSIQVWVDRAALNSDNWVEAADDLLADPTIRQAVSVYVVDQLYTSLDVPGELGNLLPADLGGLAGPLAAALRNPATDAVDRLLATDQVAAIWSDANRAAHQTIVNILRDETNPAFSTSNGVVTLSIREIVVQLARALGFSGERLEQIPDDAGQVTIAESETLASLQNAVTFVDWASWILFFVVVALYAGAVYLATGWRRIATRNVGFSIAVVGLSIVAGLRLGGTVLVDAIVSNEINRPVAQSVWWIGSALLRDLGWNHVAIGLILALGAVVAGPSRGASAVRRVSAPAFTGGAGLRWGVAVALWLVVVIWAPLPVLTTWYGVVVLAVVIALCVEGMRRLCVQDRAAVTATDAELGRVASEIVS
jgi:hypothetical protein